MTSNNLNNADATRASSQVPQDHQPLFNPDRLQAIHFGPPDATVESTRALVADYLAIKRELPRIGGAMVGSVIHLGMSNPAALREIEGVEEAMNTSITIRHGNIIEEGIAELRSLRASSSGTGSSGANTSGRGANDGGNGGSGGAGGGNAASGNGSDGQDGGRDLKGSALGDGR